MDLPVRRQELCRMALCTGLALLLFSASALAAGARPGAGRPGEKSSPTAVHVGLFLVDLAQVDTAKQSFVASFVMQARWNDPQLRSAEAGSRSIPMEQIWHPRFQIVNRLDVREMLPDSAEVDSDGNVLFIQRYYGEFAQPLNLKDFPADRQVLAVKIVSLGYRPDEVQFMRDDRMGRSGRAEQLSQAEWEAGEFRTRAGPFERGGGLPARAGFFGEIEVVRRLGFYIVKLFVPISLVVMMSWTVFWLDPKQVRSRVSVAVTSMLTITANYFLVINFLPRISYLTRMDHLAFGVILLVFVSLIVVIAGTCLEQSGREAHALKLNRWCRILLPATFIVTVILTMAI